MALSEAASRKKYLKYLLTQYDKGVLDPEKVQLLIREGLIRDGSPGAPIKDINRLKAERKWEEVMDPFDAHGTYHIYRQNITKSDWIPESVLKHSPEFVAWINSMLYGYFPNMIEYKKYVIYKVQAWRWLQEDDTISSYHTEEGRREYVMREYARIAENSLYYVNKYGELKEGDIASGLVKYKAREHHAVICYLFDCGYNVIGGKGRQIGFTSIMGLLALKKMIFQSNYYIKFVTEDKDTGEEIFTDKIKYPFGALPKWMQPRVKSDSGTRFWLSDKSKKGEKGYPNSRIDVIAPKITAINGGSPQLALIDEIGNINILGGMLNEARPTMFWNNPITGKYELKRQIWMWGTGGKMDKGHGEYEKEWYRILGLWEAKQFDNGFVPLFFSWHCRFDKYEYEKEKAWYYGARAQKLDIDLETSKTQFHQHYPSNFKDMFLTTASTLVARNIIEDGLERCRTLPTVLQPLYGYFEPIFDELDPAPPESDVPYRIIGANFIPIDDEDDFKKASVCIFQKPEQGWENRYYQGTDPIATETGHSKFASAIWDEYHKTISAVVNFRQQHDHKYTFLQGVLLGLYYDTGTGIKTGVKELVEANIGTNYTDYKELKGYFTSLVFNSQLPSKVTGGSRLIGIDNKGNRANAIIDFMTELLRNYHDRIYISVIFEQLTTFVQNLSKTGKEVWGPMNKFMHFDDVLYACTYAYICRQSHLNLYPVQKVAVTSRTKLRYQLRRNADWSMERVAVKVPVYDEYRDGEKVTTLENEDTTIRPSGD
jgi:hypothetical protein